MSKDSRSGGKYTGSHTTLIPLAATVCDIANSLAQVKKISPGYIKSGLRSVNGNRRVKISKSNDNCLLFSIRDNSSHQEVRIYVINIEKTKAILQEAFEKEFKKDKVSIDFAEK